MTKDAFGEIINSEDTFKDIAELLSVGLPVLIGWTDQEATHFDVLFTYGVTGFGNFQGGVEASDLFVSIMRIGTFGFEKVNVDTYPSYYEEKLAVGFGLGSTREKLAELINGVKKYL
jgi:hypothetical protein